MAEEDLIFCLGEPGLNKGKHDSETVSAAANVTLLSLDECDFWQMNAVTPSAVLQGTHPTTCVESTEVFFRAVHLLKMMGLRANCYCREGERKLCISKDLSTCFEGLRLMCHGASWVGSVKAVELITFFILVKGMLINETPYCSLYTSANSQHSVAHGFNLCCHQKKIH